jgi:hypothetical protein
MGTPAIDGTMKSFYILFSIFAVLFGTLAVAHSATTIHIPDGVSCTDKRMVSNGYSNKQIALAELAAIVKWQKQTEERDPGFGNWHQALKRSIKCKPYKNTSHFQCVVSATPCRLDKS